MLPARIQLPPDYNLQQLLTETFEQFPINRLQYYIWRWYRAALEYQPYNYCNCPSRVIDMHQTLETFILLAIQLENELPEVIKLAHPVYASDAFNQDILFNKGLSKNFEAYEGVIRHLFETEAANPALFFVRFFRFKPAEAWLQLLDDWQEFALNSAGMDEIWNIEEMPEALELLLALCEACWLIKEASVNNEGEGVEDKVERKGENEGESNLEHKAEPGNKDASKANDEDQQAIIEMIRQSIDVDMIFLLGKFAMQPAALGHEYCLLVLGNYKNGKPMDELESIIRNRSNELPPVFATVMQTKKVANLLEQGNWFMHRWCAPEKRVYQAGDSTLPYQPEVKPPSPAQMLETYRLHFGKASSFLSGARSFLAQEEFALSGFMLHQCMEAALMAMLVPAMQHSFRTHSLHKLLCMVRHLSPEIGKPFPRDTEEEIILFQLLQKAYIHARYKDNFSISRAQCEALISRVAWVMEMLPGEFGQVVMAIHGEES